MEDVFEFKVGKDLEKIFFKRASKIEKGVFKFDYTDYKKDYSKAYKIIASIIEDNWKILSVIHNNSFIITKAEKREKKSFTFPETDNHFKRNKDRYQFHTLLAAMSQVRNTKLALDIGGHIGLYSAALTDFFEQVKAFEPAPPNINCFKKNVPMAELYEVALGEQPGSVELHLAPENTGNNSIVEVSGKEKVLVPVKTLDSFHFANVGLIKIDVQGYEEQVLKGAKNTILDNKPVMIVELITHKDSDPNQEALDVLKSYDYVIHSTMGKDYILTHKSFREG